MTVARAQLFLGQDSSAAPQVLSPIAFAPLSQRSPLSFPNTKGNHVLAPVMLLQSFQQQPLLQIQQVSLHPYILLYLNPLSNPYILLYSVVPASFRCPHTHISHFHTGTTGIPSSVPSSSYVISRHFQSLCALAYFASGGTSLL